MREDHRFAVRRPICGRKQGVSEAPQLGVTGQLFVSDHPLPRRKLTLVIGFVAIGEVGLSCIPELFG